MGRARSLARVLERAGEPLGGFPALFVTNHEGGGFDHPGCAWPDDPNGLKLDSCENGVKHTTWEMFRPVRPDHGVPRLRAGVRPGGVPGRPRGLFLAFWCLGDRVAAVMNANIWRVGDAVERLLREGGSAYDVPLE
jgi:hypothetical protein